ncbi:hypothetical protein COU60_04465 [Candidatus Pacearchaeota archaeon CG10_big_fil_rev_8_21_14_0_10_34_76]|nr:MAG: hypothetical protein COU60_04465 [Candidatus Pacearchaeota archaeon CG10_big_fil_rev_8_21_14_0_10_34_76]
MDYKTLIGLLGAIDDDILQRVILSDRLEREMGKFRDIYATSADGDEDLLEGPEDPAYLEVDAS